MHQHSPTSTATIDQNTEHTVDLTNATLSHSQAPSQFGRGTSPCLYGLSSSSTTFWWVTPSFCSNVGRPWDPPPHQRSVPWWSRWKNKHGISHFSISFTITKHTNICSSNISTHTHYHFSLRDMWTTELSFCPSAPQTYRVSGSCWANHFYRQPIQLEYEPANTFLGFDVHLSPPSIRYAAACQSDDVLAPNSASPASTTLSSLQARMITINRACAPARHADTAAAPLRQLYVQAGFSTAEVEGILAGCKWARRGVR